MWKYKNVFSLSLDSPILVCFPQNQPKTIFSSGRPCSSCIVLHEGESSPKKKPFLIISLTPSLLDGFESFYDSYELKTEGKEERRLQWQKLFLNYGRLRRLLEGVCLSAYFFSDSNESGNYTPYEFKMLLV